MSDPAPVPPKRRRAKMYKRPRLGFKLTPQVLFSLLGLLLSLAVTAWWAMRHVHTGR